MTIEIKMIPAVIFYVLYLAGLAVFAISPVLDEQGWLVAAVVLLLVAFVYVTYDLIRIARLKSWSLSLTLADIAMGTVVSLAFGVAGFYIA